MYIVKLKTGLSPSADDYSKSEPKKKRSLFIGSCTLCVGYTRL